MIEICNKLETNLVIPKGRKNGGSLTLAPRGTGAQAKASVDELTDSLKDAEKRRLVKFIYPTEKNGKSDAKPQKKDGKTDPRAKSDGKEKG